MRHPHHAYQSYIGKLVDSGWKVAVCEQVEDPKAAKGIVKREVVRVVTPGSLVDEKEFDRKANLYMAAVWGEKTSMAWPMWTSPQVNFD